MPASAKGKGGGKGGKARKGNDDDKVPIREKAVKVTVKEAEKDKVVMRGGKGQRDNASPNQNNGISRGKGDHGGKGQREQARPHRESNDNSQGKGKGRREEGKVGKGGQQVGKGYRGEQKEEHSKGGARRDQRAPSEEVKHTNSKERTRNEGGKGNKGDHARGGYNQGKGHNAQSVASQPPVSQAAHGHNQGHRDTGKGGKDKWSRGSPPQHTNGHNDTRSGRSDRGKANLDDHTDRSRPRYQRDGPNFQTRPKSESELQFEKEREVQQRLEQEMEKKREKERKQWEKEREISEMKWKEEREREFKQRENEMRRREQELQEKEKEEKRKAAEEERLRKAAEAKYTIKGKLGVRTEEACSMGAGKAFVDMKVMRAVCDNLSNEDITHPLPLQAKCLPLALKEYDVYALAKEGTGKVLTWAIIALQRMLTKGGGGSGQSIEPGILVLVPHQNAAENGAEVLRRLNSPGPSVSLYKGAFPERATGAEALVITMDTAAALLKMNRLSLKRVHTFVVDDCTAFDKAHAEASFPEILKRLKEQTKDNKTEMQTIAFTSDMSSPIDKLLQPVLRKDRICYHSVQQALPSWVGVSYSFLKLTNQRQKLEILPQITKVPGMDKIVVVCWEREVSAVRGAVVDVKNYSLTVWADVDSEKQHDATCSAMRSTERSLVIMTPACYERFDHDREEQDVAMYVLFDPQCAQKVKDARRRMWSKTCRVFMAVLLSADAHTDAAAVVEFGKSMGVQPRIKQCLPYETSLAAVILETEEVTEALPTQAQTQVQAVQVEEDQTLQAQTQTQTQIHKPVQTIQPQYHQQGQRRGPRQHEGRSGWNNNNKGYASAGDKVEEAIEVGQLDQGAVAALNKLSLEEAAGICDEMLSNMHTITNPSGYVTAKVMKRLRNMSGNRGGW